MENRLPKEGWFVDCDGSKEFDIITKHIYDNFNIPFYGNKGVSYGVGEGKPFCLSSIAARQIKSFTKLSIEEFVEMSKPIIDDKNHMLDAFFYSYGANKHMIWGFDFGFPDGDQKAKGKYTVFPNNELIEEMKKYTWKADKDSLVDEDKLFNRSIPSLESINVSLASIYMLKNKYYPESYPSEKDIEAMYNCIHKDKACAMFEELCNMFPVYGLSKRVEILTEFLDSHNLPHDPTETFTLTDTGDFRRHFH